MPPVPPADTASCWMYGRFEANVVRARNGELRLDHKHSLGLQACELSFEDPFDGGAQRTFQLPLEKEWEELLERPG